MARRTHSIHRFNAVCLYDKRKFSDLYLDMTLTQRSSDYIMAGYINKMQYVAFQMMVAGHLGYKVGHFSHIVQNLHIYDRHAAMELKNLLGITAHFKREELHDYRETLRYLHLESQRSGVPLR